MSLHQTLSSKSTDKSAPLVTRSPRKAGSNSSNHSSNKQPLTASAKLGTSLGLRNSNAVGIPPRNVPSSSSSASLGLPSPTGSASETSDYQRSTPSPRDEPDSGIGSVDDWHHPSLSSDNPTPRGGNNGNGEDSDHGFSECPNNNNKSIIDPLRPPTSSSSVILPIDPRLMLQQVRVALEKIPIDHHNNKLSSSSLSSSNNKRRHSADQLSESNKRTRIIEESQSKITSFMSETKHFTALRKEKLDLVLNLLKDPDHVVKKEVVDEEEQQVVLDVKLLNKNDLFLISQLKQLKDKLREEEEEEVLLKKKGEDEVVVVHVDDAKFEVPKIRFPVKSRENDSTIITCKWQGCGKVLESTGKLIDHLKLTHAITTHKKEDDSVVYRCHWLGCKVFGKSSSSKSWLEKHVSFCHGGHGNKPFACIVDGCRMRFGTQSLLERHVNGHFKKAAGGGSCNVNGTSGGFYTSSSSSSSSSSTAEASAVSAKQCSLLTPPPSAVKAIKKAGRRLKYRKTIFSARIFDLFDLGVMQQVRERLSRIHLSRIRNGELTLESSVLARRKDEQGKTLVLLRWRPENILEDSWLPLDAAKTTQTVKVTSLPHQTQLDLLIGLLEGGGEGPETPPQMQKRKSSNFESKEGSEIEGRRRRKAKCPRQNHDALS